MNGLRTLFLQDLACALTSKPFQYGSACQLHTGSSCRRFWNLFEFPKTEEPLSGIEKSSKDLRIPLASAPREPVATSTGSTVAGNARGLPSTSFGFDGNTAVYYRSTNKFHKPFAKRKVEETSLLDGNPVPRNLKLKLQGYKMLESEFAGFEMAGFGEERTTEDVFEIRGVSKMSENSIQSRSAAKEAKRDARETACKDDEAVYLASVLEPKLSGESKSDAIPWDLQAPRPPSIPPPPCCPPPSQPPSPPPDPQCPSREPSCPSKTPAESWSPPNSHPDNKPTCPPPCPRTCTMAPGQSTEQCSSVVLPESATVRQGAGRDCEGPSSEAGSSSLGTASQSQPSENQMASSLAVSFPKEPSRSVDSACPLSPATPATPATPFAPAVPAAPSSCSGGTRIPSASVTIPSLRLKESRTSLNSISSGRSVSGLSSIGSVGVLTNSSGQSALPRTARSLPGFPRESKKASAACTAKSQSSCSARNDCPRSKSSAKKREESSCKKEADRCKRKGCFDDENDSSCANKAGCPERKKARKKKCRRTRKTCSARVSKPPKRKSKVKEKARRRSSCGGKALDDTRGAAAVCPERMTEETCSTKKPQCPARKKSKSKKDVCTRKGPSCTRERDSCKRSRERSCGSSKSVAKKRAKSEEKRSRSPCSPRRAKCSKERRKSNVCKGYVCPGNAGTETCTTNKPQCPREKKKSASKKRKGSCSRGSDKSCPSNRSQSSGRRGSCGSRSFCTHLPRRPSPPILGRFYGRDVNDGKDHAKCGEDIIARKYPKPGPKCKKSSIEERDVSCQRGTRTLSCEEGRVKKSEVNSTRAKKDDVQSVKDQLAKEREEVERCKKGGSRASRRTTSESRKQSCAKEKVAKVREAAESKDSAGKAETGVKRVISPCKLKKAGPCKDTKSSCDRAKKKKEKEKGEGKRCSSVQANDVQCIVRYAPKLLLESAMSRVELLRQYSGGTCRIESSKDTSLHTRESHERPVLEDDRCSRMDDSTQNVFSWVSTW